MQLLHRDESARRASGEGLITMRLSPVDASVPPPQPKPNVLSATAVVRRAEGHPA